MVGMVRMVRMVGMVRMGGWSGWEEERRKTKTAGSSFQGEHSTTTGTEKVWESVGNEERVAERGAEGVQEDVLDLGDARAEAPLQDFDQQGAEEADWDDRPAQGRQRGKAEAERHEARDIPDEKEDERHDSRAPEVRGSRERNELPPSRKRRRRRCPRSPHGDSEQERRVERESDAPRRRYASIYQG